MPTNTPFFSNIIFSSDDEPDSNPYRKAPDNQPVIVPNPHHAKLTGGRTTGSTVHKDFASAYVTLRRPNANLTRQIFACTGQLDGATRAQAIDVLEQVLLDALDDVRKMRSE